MLLFPAFGRVRDASGLPLPAALIVRGSRMGRGRQKAKHTKIARELKSYSPSVNYHALERELGHPENEENLYIDKWAEYADEDENEPAKGA